MSMSFEAPQLAILWSRNILVFLFDDLFFSTLCAISSYCGKLPMLLSRNGHWVLEAGYLMHKMYPSFMISLTFLSYSDL